MKTMLFAGAAAILTAATPAAAQHAPRIEYGTVPNTVSGTVSGTVPSTVVVTTTNWGPPPAPMPAPQDPYGYEPRIPYAPVPVDADVFAGPRIEAQIGFDRLTDEAGGLLFAGDGDGRNGLSYGGEIGYDFAVGTSLVLGAYAGAEGSTIKQCDTFIGFEQCVRAGRSFTAGGRIGFALSPFAMLYAKGGYTNGRITAEGRAVVPNAQTIRERETLDGFHVGGGLEAAFGRNAYGKVEYVYTKLRDLPIVVGAEDIRIDLERHQIRAGVGLRL